jgi:AcrR family transcriptional regulator
MLRPAETRKRDMADDFDDDDEGGDPPSRKASAGKEGGGKIIRFPGRLSSGAVRPRHDGFTPAKQRKFFKTLKKCGCIKDACRVAGISRTTVNRWRDKDELFHDMVEKACALASVELDMIAWKRATEGTREEIWRDGRLVFVRVKQSDAMLRLLMQGANPEKYGRTGQLPRKNKHLLKKWRKHAEYEAKAAYSEGNRKALTERLTGLVAMLARRDERAKLAAGWLPGPDGALVVPPGWRMVPAVPLLPPPAARPD